MGMMLVTQALDERDLLVKKIGDKIRKVSFIDTAKHNEEKVMTGKVARTDYDAQAKASYQQIMDLIDRYQQVDAAIVASNASTFVETSYGRFTVAAAIAMRSRLMENSVYGDGAAFETKLLKKMESEYQTRVQIMDNKNGQLQETAEQMRLSILGKDSKTKEDRPLGVVDEYVKENATELVDPIDIQKKIDALKEKKERLLSELNTQIKVANATTVIEV